MAGVANELENYLEQEFTGQFIHAFPNARPGSRDRQPHKRYFYHILNLRGNNSFLEIWDMVRIKADRLLLKIDRLLDIKNHRISAFTIGKSSSTGSEFTDLLNHNPRRWIVRNIQSRWFSKYHNMGYAFLVAFVVVTRENIDTTRVRFLRQQDLALALENRLIQCYAFERNDQRVDNRSLASGNIGDEEMAGIVYLAIQSEHLPAEGDEDPLLYVRVLFEEGINDELD